jgi:hypothetical protein
MLGGNLNLDKKNVWHIEVEVLDSFSLHSGMNKSTDIAMVEDTLV